MLPAVSEQLLFALENDMSGKLQTVGVFLAGYLLIAAGCSDQPADNPPGDGAANTPPANTQTPDANDDGSSSASSNSTTTDNSTSTPPPGDVVQVKPSVFKTEVEEDIDAAEKKYVQGQDAPISRPRQVCALLGREGLDDRVGG